MALGLYHTEGCHLCEQALALLEAAALPVTLQEIMADEQLLLRYRERIPVVAVGTKELGWPFDGEQLAQFIRRYPV